MPAESKMPTALRPSKHELMETPQSAQPVKSILHILNGRGVVAPDLDTGMGDLLLRTPYGVLIAD